MPEEKQIIKIQPIPVPPELIQKFNQEIEVLKKKAEGVIVADEDSYGNANGQLVYVKGQFKAIDKIFGDPKRAIYNEYKKWISVISDFEKKLKAVEKILSGKIGPYIIKKQEEEEKARQAIIKKQEEERLRDAEAMAEMGEDEEAEKILDKKIRVSSKDVPKMDRGGTFVQKRWYAEVTNKMDLIKAVANGDVPPDAIAPVMPWLNSEAVRLKENFKIPGVKANFRTNVGSRG